MSRIVSAQFGAPWSDINPFYFSEGYLPTKSSEVPHKAQTERPVLLLIPELLAGRPSPCAYIRLLIPLTSPAIRDRFEIRVGALHSTPAVSPSAVVVNRIPCERASDLEPFFEHLRATGAKLIYDIDDQLLDLPDNHPEADHYKERQAIVARLLAEAHLVWASTDALTEALKSRCKSIATIENCFDTFGSEFVQPRPSQPQMNSRFNVLYMGTATHDQDLNIVLEPLQRLVSEGQKLNLHLIGISTNPPKHNWIRTIQPPSSASTYPRFTQWLRALNGFDLGIAPLESSRFNSCKSAIKFWDYTAMRIPTLASDVEAYRGTIQDGHTGFLTANDANSWHDKLRHVISEREQLPQVTMNAIDSLRNRFAELNCTERRMHLILDALRMAGG